MKDKIIELLTGLIPDDVLQDINNNYTKYSEVPLNQLGFDSMSTISLVVKLEKMMHIDFDYENFDVNSLSTIANLSKLIENN